MKLIRRTKVSSLPHITRSSSDMSYQSSIGIDVTLTLIVLTGTSLCHLDVSGEAAMCNILDMVKARHDDGVDQYLGNCKDTKMSFYLLKPPPLIKDLQLLDDETTVGNIDVILRDVEKTKLSRFDIAGEVFGVRPSMRTVALVIEKPLGKYSILCLLPP